ncbi:MAG: hypothetical protein M3Z23_13400, partial [Acidobacteriota bacterium]|nr:hypothetical protein [Acidobacteriota bacterium]
MTDPVDDWFGLLAQQATGLEEPRASSRLKSRVYSALMQAEAAQGALASLTECEREGRSLCMWERLVRITPVPEAVKDLNHCYLCHARLAGERLERAPLHWHGCPY